MSNSAVLRGKVSRCKSATEFPRKCGRCVKIERQNFLGKIVAATDFPRKFCRATKFPSDRISCDTGLVFAPMDVRTAFYFAQGLAASSIKTYQSGVNRYLKFCQSKHSPLPVSQCILCEFVSQLASNIGK